MLMIPKVFKNSFPSKKKKKKKSSLSQKNISSHNSYLTPPKNIKHIKKLNFGWPQKLTHNHVHSLIKICLWCVQLVRVLDTQNVICRWKISTILTLSIT